MCISFPFLVYYISCLYMYIRMPHLHVNDWHCKCSVTCRFPSWIYLYLDIIPADVVCVVPCHLSGNLLCKTLQVWCGCAMSPIRRLAVRVLQVWCVLCHVTYLATCRASLAGVVEKAREKKKRQDSGEGSSHSVTETQTEGVSEATSLTRLITMNENALSPIYT